MGDDEDRRPRPADQKQAGEEGSAPDSDEPRHTVTYSRRRFMVMLGGAAVAATGLFELARQLGGPVETGRGGQRRQFSGFPVTSIDVPHTYF